MKGFAEGFMISFLNPKILVFFVAVFSQFIHGELTRIDSAIIVLVAGVIDTFWYVFIALLLAGAGLIEKIKKYSFWIDRALYTNQCNYSFATSNSPFRVTGSGVVIADCAFTHTPGVSTTFTNSPNPNGWTIIKNLDDCHESDYFPSGCAPQNIAVKVIFRD